MSRALKGQALGLLSQCFSLRAFFLTHHIDSEHSPSFKNSQGPTFQIRKMSQSSFIQLHITPPPLKWNNSGTIDCLCERRPRPPRFSSPLSRKQGSLHVIYVSIKVGLPFMYHSRLYTSASTWEQNLKNINSVWRELIFQNWVHGAFNINTSFLPTVQ